MIYIAAWCFQEASVDLVYIQPNMGSSFSVEGVPLRCYEYPLPSEGGDIQVLT